ncbi:MAG: hypothetical protein WAU86_07340 [Oricola sp.]
METGEAELRHLARHAVVDRIGVDVDRGMIVLGPHARKFHGLSVDSETTGIRQFLDCYHEADRAGLLCLLERLARDEQPIHYTARLAGSDGQFVHGFVEHADEGDDGFGAWSGVVVMSRSGLVSPARLPKAC